ncbi:hypothetical protein AN161_11145 [Lysinibacillus sp. FJAT-14222]|nr:hypothetical protein AN161_11145 [Lysinibacillus sp. FJAT-14222]
MQLYPSEKKINIFEKIYVIKPNINIAFFVLVLYFKNSCKEMMLIKITLEWWENETLYKRRY